METLLNHGASLEVCDADGQTPLWAAADKGHNGALKFLLTRGGEIEALDGQGLSPLGVAAREGHESTVELLLDEGAVIEARDKEGRTSLHLAVENHHEAVVLLLLQRGCNVECTDNNGFTPLLVTAARGQFSLLMVLLERGAKVSTVAGGRSALGWAAWAGNDGLIGPLIAAGAYTNPPQEETPLFLAASRGHTMIVKILIDHGIQLDQDERIRALSAAEENGHDAVVRLLSRVPSRSPTTRLYPSLTRPYQYRPLAGPSHIRLLELHPASADDDLVSFTLNQADLSTNPCYQALSYEWGERSCSVPVLCDDSILLVTPNLRAALKRIRSREGQVVALWIDAVCINQEDIPERNEQVAMMARIFRSAEGTILWLGDRSDTDTFAPAALGMLTVFQEVYRVLTRMPGRIEYADTLTDDQSRLITALLSRVQDLPSALAGLRELCYCTYFTRAWILQEMVLSRRGVVTWGAHTLDWRVFKEALWAIRLSPALECWAEESYPSAASPLLSAIRQSFHGRNKGLERILIYTLHMDESVSRNLEQGVSALISFRAQDPRDKIYAALGFTALGLTPSCTNNTPPLQADYTLTPAQVFTAAAANIITTTQSLNFWGTLNRRRNKRTPSLPTWVPDWGHTLFTPGIMAPRGSARRAHLIPRGKMHTAGTSLYLSAYLLDKVAYAVPLTPATDIVADVVLPIANFLASRGGDVFARYRGLVPPARMRERFGQLEREVRAWHGLDPLLEGMDYLEALWRVINTGDGRAETAREVCSFWAWRVVLAGRGREGVDGDAVREWEKWGWEEDVEAEVFDGVCERMEAMVGYDVDVVVTEKGYFAITGAGMAEKGMVIAVLESAEAFGLLEEKRDEQTGERFYEYLDEAYMDGWCESLDDIETGAKVETVELR